MRNHVWNKNEKKKQTNKKTKKTITKNQNKMEKSNKLFS